MKKCFIEKQEMLMKSSIFYHSFLQLISGECNLFLQILAKGVFPYFFQNKQQFF